MTLPDGSLLHRKITWEGPFSSLKVTSLSPPPSPISPEAEETRDYSDEHQLYIDVTEFRVILNYPTGSEKLTLEELLATGWELIGMLEQGMPLLWSRLSGASIGGTRRAHTPRLALSGILRQNHPRGIRPPNPR